MKTIDEMIAVMTAYKNGAEIEVERTDKNDWTLNTFPSWNWKDYNYRIKEQKKTVTIEKWLIKSETIDSIKDYYFVCETSNIDGYLENIECEKVKLLGSYEVEI